MALNKVNLCWVLSDGRRGHEIQSTTLATGLAEQTNILPFYIKQPWDSFTPRLMPLFKRGICWHRGTPNFKQNPDLIITTGRKAAAAGKYVIAKLSRTVPHIQILHPGDRPSQYDLLLLPAHDQKTGPNIITFNGSIHPYHPTWFNPVNSYHETPCPVIMLGNPKAAYFESQWPAELDQIKSSYPGAPLFVCGSPRTQSKIKHRVRGSLSAADNCWFGADDGDNPYVAWMRAASHLFVTTDSINMMNECAASHALVSLLAKDFIPSPKHRRFIDSCVERWTGLAKNNSQEQADLALRTLPVKYALDQVLADDRLLKLLKSPNSSSGG